MDIKKLFLLGAAFVCVIPTLALADFCPQASSLITLNGNVIGTDSAGRVVTYSGTFPLAGAVFSGANILFDPPMIMGNLGCVYTDSQGSGHNLTDFNPNENVVSTGNNWLTNGGALSACQSQDNNPKECQYTAA